MILLAQNLDSEVRMRNHNLSLKVASNIDNALKASLLLTALKEWNVRT